VVKVVWVSRVQPLPAQLRMLRELLGEYRLVLVRPPARLDGDEQQRRLVERVRALRPDVVVVFAPRGAYARLASKMLGAGLEVWYCASVTLHREVGGLCSEFDPSSDVLVVRGDAVLHKRVAQFLKVVGVVEGDGGRLHLEVVPLDRCDVLV